MTTDEDMRRAKREMEEAAIEAGRAYEEAVRDHLQERLRQFDPDRGEFKLELVGQYPDTKLLIAGKGLATARPRTWQFDLWKGWLWEDSGGDVGGTATMIYANMDD